MIAAWSHKDLSISWNKILLPNPIKELIAWCMEGSCGEKGFGKACLFLLECHWCLCQPGCRSELCCGTGVTPGATSQETFHKTKEWEQSSPSPEPLPPSAPEEQPPHSADLNRISFDSMKQQRLSPGNFSNPHFAEFRFEKFGFCLRVSLDTSDVNILFRIF